MSVEIKRLGDAEYVLIGDDGEEIKTYEQSRMRHPDDWIADARDAGETVSGPYHWTYSDVRDQE